MAPAATRPVHEWFVSPALSSVYSWKTLLRRILTDSFSRTRPSTATTRANTVLLLVREVCMTGPWKLIHRAVSVIFGSLVLVHDAHANGSPERDTHLCT